MSRLFEYIANKVLVDVQETTFVMGDEYDIAMESEVGSFKSKKGVIIINVYPNDGENIPHFHFNSMKTGGSNKNTDLDGCICLEEPLYFPHGHHKSRLTNAQAKHLEKFMKQKNDKYPDKTNWEKAKEVWESPTNHNPLRVNECPDYSKLNK